MTLNHARFADFQRSRAIRDVGPAATHLLPVRDNVETYGWHIQSVLAEPGRFSWHYTIGFGDSLGHPDLVVFGLSQDVAAVVLNDIGDAIAEGQKFHEGVRYGDFLVDIDVEFRATLPRWHPALFGRANDWYDTYPPMWQVVIPDRENRLPDDPDEKASLFQLLLWSDRPAPEYLEHEHTPVDVGEGWAALTTDLLDEHETGWEEAIIVTSGASADLFVVASVPFVDHLSFGDEVEVQEVDGILRVTRATQRAPIATVRVCVISGSGETKQRLDKLIDAVDASEAVWESPVQFWFFFAVPHHCYGWFMELIDPMQRDGLVSLRATRAP